MNKNKAISIILIFSIYSLASIMINKSFVLPKISEIAFSLKDIVFSKNFLITVSFSLYRVIAGLIISLLLALLLSFLSYFNKTIKELLQPLYSLLKSIPNVAYILVSLLWVGRDGSVLLVSCFVMFPILYNSILGALENIDVDLTELTNMHNGSLLFKVKNIYLPLINYDLLIGVKNSASLGLKVVVMSEILAQIKVGIGRELNIARLNYLMSDVFAWTLIIIVISYLIDNILDILIKRASLNK